MSAELWILVATVVLAVVAIGAALIALRAVRRLEAAAPASAVVALPDQPIAEHKPQPEPATRPVAEVVVLNPYDSLEPRSVQGRLIVPPTQEQVVRTALGRPGVRLSVVAHGVAHALRAESRDRISALMRREYRRRRRNRLQAGRRAVRDARPTPSSEEWLGS